MGLDPVILTLSQDRTRSSHYDPQTGRARPGHNDSQTERGSTLPLSISDRTELGPFIMTLRQECARSSHYDSKTGRGWDLPL
ncbi:hypothetical protein DPMN_129501 [Dreissena polymorpha]|uniref:Uncharacterized protein n=1 Tax=Dreissena polymorpha TaxID=45954 RepID=A0A9D4H5X0_DREPO|nr:hypothetical protein DPMN_129501 [Dreissena polymorpha]